MEQEQILSTIREQLGTTNLSDRTLMSYIGSHLPTEGTEPSEEYFASAVNFFKSLDGQYNHDVSTRVNEFKKNYKPEGLEPPIPAEGDDDISALRTELKALRELIGHRDVEHAAERMRQSVIDKHEELKVRNVNLWRDAVSMVEMSNETTEADLLSSAKHLYEAKLKSYFGDGARPYGSKENSHAGEAEANAKLREAYLSKLRKEGKI